MLTQLRSQYGNISDRQIEFSQGPAGLTTRLKAPIVEILKKYDSRSHGESFMDLFTQRVQPRGLYLLDEPEAPLSPKRQIAFLDVLIRAARSGAQCPGSAVRVPASGSASQQAKPRRPPQPRKFLRARPRQRLRLSKRKPNRRFRSRCPFSRARVDGYASAGEIPVGGSAAEVPSHTRYSGCVSTALSQTATDPPRRKRHRAGSKYAGGRAQAAQPSEAEPCLPPSRRSIKTTWHACGRSRSSTATRREPSPRRRWTSPRSPSRGSLLQGPRRSADFPRQPHRTPPRICRRRLHLERKISACHLSSHHASPDISG